jgi:carbon dioxide concentrating mechanism protein CcmM
MRYLLLTFIIPYLTFISRVYAGDIMPGAITSWSKTAKVPRISETAYISPNATVIGNVYIGDRVYVGPGASIRGDEGMPIYIGDDSNVQDGVIIHALKDKYVKVEGKKYAVYIGKEVSCAHGSIIHGPCAIGDRSFIGFNATVFKAIIGEDCVVLHHALVTNNVKVPDGKYVPMGAVIDAQGLADALLDITKDLARLKEEVVKVNKELAEGY